MDLSEQPWYDDSASTDRLVFSALLALIVHAAIILGIGFAREDPGSAARSLEVTLALFHQNETVESADYLAQANQQGSGSESRRAEPTTPVASEFVGSHITAVQQTAQQSMQPQAAEPVIDSTHSEQARATETAQPHPRDTEYQSAGTALVSRKQEEIASLIARLDAQQNAYARLPRIHRITSVSARAAVDASYLLAWQQRVEAIGNQNYPNEARKRRLYGDLRLLVALKPNGLVYEIRVLQSSGYKILDDAAVRIVRLTEPFDPFPPELRGRVDVLEIIRTWQFRSSGLTASD